MASVLRCWVAVAEGFSLSQSCQTTGLNNRDGKWQGRFSECCCKTSEKIHQPKVARPVIAPLRLMLKETVSFHWTEPWPFFFAVSHIFIIFLWQIWAHASHLWMKQPKKDSCSWQPCNAEHLHGAQRMGPALPRDAREEQKEIVSSRALLYHLGPHWWEESLQTRLHQVMLT